VSFIKRAQDAAKGAAEHAQIAAGQAKTAAGQAAAGASRTATDPATQERLGKGAREAMGMARRGISTVVERIDPGTLAEVIIKATALQEMTNASLRKKGSPYRISEISISASIPPGVTFAIGRIDDHEEVLTGREVSSAELVEQLPDDADAVIALDGTTLDRQGLGEVRAALVAELPEELGGPS
jgi:hypothetical protein